jgi:hypothetical protein
MKLTISFLLFMVITIGNTAFANQKIETDFSCTVLSHKFIWVRDGRVSEYPGMGDEAATGSKINFKLKLHGSKELAFTGSIPNSKTDFTFIGFFEVVEKWLREISPYTFVFTEPNSSISPDLLLFHGLGKQLSLKRYSEGKWDGNIVRIKDGSVLITTITCLHAGSGLQQLFNYLTDAGY